MLCPICKAETPANATRCPKCSASLPSLQDDTQTVYGVVTPTPTPTPPRRPPDDTGATTGPVLASGQASSFARPGAGGAPVRFEKGDDFGPRYRIESLIGEGGMGQVYKAFDKELERTVALKLVRAELASDPASMQRFKQELLLASRISHKNILRIHDLGDVQGTKFISMTYVEGEDLDDVIRREGRIPLDRAIAIAKRLCAALEAAHGEGVVHRDLKPRNILIDRADNIYISDFGLAKSLEANASTMTRTGEILGTPRYMSPEQAEALPTDHRSDLYALGLIIYEMVTGDIPFRGDSMLQVMYQRVTQPPKSPQLLAPELPDYLTAIIMRCLEKDLGRRYQNAREILQDLEAERATPPPEGAGDSLSAIPQAAPAVVAPKTGVTVIREPKAGRRKWVMIAAAAVLAAGLSMAIPSVRNAIFKKPDKYMAILPFRTIGDDTALKYQAEGVVEALSAKFFQLKNMHLAYATAVTGAANANKDSVDKIARTLGVNLIVQGTVQGAGDKISVAVTLDDVAAHKTLWSQEFSGLRQDLLTLEDEIYNKLVAGLELKLGNEELASGAKRPTEDIGAYDLYLRARNLARSTKDQKNLNAALDLYDQAVKKDPNFALAYSGIADACIAMYDLVKDSVWSERALVAAHQAQRLNDNLPEVHSSLGGAYRLTGKTAEAIVEFTRAVALAPNSDEGYRRLGAAYLATGRKTEAVQVFEKVVKLNPYYWFNYNRLGNAYLQSGENEKALAAFRKVIELEPGNAGGYSDTGIAYYRQGKWSESVSAFLKSLEVKPTAGVYSNLGVAYLYQGNYAEAVKVFEKAVAMSPISLNIGNLADAYRYSGQSEKAMATYDQAIGLSFKALQVNPSDAGVLGNLALYYAKKGDSKQALEFMRRARAIDADANELLYNQGVVDALAGQHAEALQSLRAAFEKGYPSREAKNDPELKPLHANPEFDKLIKEFSEKTN